MRHGDHGLLPHTLAGRMPGVGLSETGRAQAAGLAEQFMRAGAAAVVSSPVQRAVETAAPIAARLGLAVALEAGFEEIDFGAWTGRRFDSLAGDPAWEAWNRVRALAACPAGETMHGAQSRAMLALGRVRTAFPGDAVVVVSHSDIIKAVLAAALGFGLDRLDRLAVAPGSWSTLTLFDHDVRVECVNRVAGCGA